MLFLSQKVDGKMIFSDYWKFFLLVVSRIGYTVIFWAIKLMERRYLLITEKLFVLNFSVMGIRSFFESRSWWKDDIYCLPRRSCFELFGDGKYGLFQPKSWLKDDIYLVFLSFPWYSRTWEIWFFAQWKLKFKSGSFAFSNKLLYKILFIIFFPCKWKCL